MVGEWYGILGILIGNASSAYGAWYWAKGKYLRQGYLNGWHDYQNKVGISAQPTKFRQRTLQADSGRHARVRTARVLAFRSPTEPIRRPNQQ